MRTKVISLATFGVAVAYAWWRSVPLRWPVIAVALPAVLCVDMATTAFNTFFDFLRGVDHSDTNRETDKVLVHAGVGAGYALVTALVLVTVAGMLGLVLAMLVDWRLLPVGVLCVTVGFLYTGGPRPISRTPFGEVFAGGFLGSGLFLIVVWIAGVPIDGAALGVSLPLSVLVGAVLTVNNTCDRLGDQRAGRRTLSIIVGPLWGPRLIVTFTLTGYAAIAVSSVAGLLPSSTPALVAGAVGLAFTMHRLAGMGRRGYSHATKGASMRSIVQVYLITAAAMVVAFVIDGRLS